MINDLCLFHSERYKQQIQSSHEAVNEKQDLQCTYQLNITTRPRIDCCHGEGKIIAYSVCVCVCVCVCL